MGFKCLHFVIAIFTLPQTDFFIPNENRDLFCRQNWRYLIKYVMP